MWMLQVALGSAQEKLTSGHAVETVRKLGIMEVALKQAICDYHSVLSEMSQLHKAMQHKDGKAAACKDAIQDLQKQLHKANSQMDSYR